MENGVYLPMGREWRGVTLFHGSEPYREGKPTDMVRTDSKGVKIAQELIGGARREGRKFLRYHYDNPGRPLM